MSRLENGPPEGKYVDVGGGLKVHYHEAGPAGAPAVIFLHGSGPGASAWSNFKHNFPFFAERGHRAILVDTLGFGYSSKPEDVDYTLAFMASGAVKLMDALGITKAALVGNSHGGAQAIQIALDHPSRVSKLVLMAPGGLEVRETYMKMEGIRAMMKAFLGEGGMTRDALKKVLELQLHDPAKLDDETLDERFAVAKIMPKRVLSSMQVPHLAPELPRLGMPVFGLWGMNDKFCPSSGAQTIASSVTGSRVLLVNGCGHWVMVEHPAMFNRMCLDFLAEGV